MSDRDPAAAAPVTESEKDRCLEATAFDHCCRVCALDETAARAQISAIIATAGDRAEMLDDVMATVAALAAGAEQRARQRCAEQLHCVNTWEQVHMLTARWAAGHEPCGATGRRDGFERGPCLRRPDHVVPGHDDGEGGRW
jgi:hypothetical protein